MGYQIMSVLFNYKRTVEDFKRCLPKGHNDYGFAHISDCVGGKMNEIFKKKGGKKCKESSHPVPCGDGSCQTDYISCLKVMSKIELNDDVKGGSGDGSGMVQLAKKQSALMKMLQRNSFEYGDMGEDDDE